MHLHNYVRYLLFYRNLKSPILADASGRMVLAKESKEWEDEYIPKEGVYNETILDVGAGSGETAWFYFQHGASKVICIEPDVRRLQMLAANARGLNWNVEIVPRRFVLEDLSRKFDFAKIDCEGGEKILLSLRELPPCAIEIHSPQLSKKFKERFPKMHITKKYHWPFDTWMGKLD